MGQLFVVRHGQASLLSADYDRLSELGRAQATALGRLWAQQGERFDAVFTGPAVRHRDTTSLVGEAITAAGGEWMTPVLLPELDEHDAFALVAKAAPRLKEDPEVGPLQEAVARTVDPKGRSAAFQRLFEAVMNRWLLGVLDLDDVEPWPAFRDRVERGLRTMIDGANRGGRIVAFTSVGPIAVMLRAALQLTDRRSFETAWRVRNASITSFVFGRGEITLDGFNAMPHLPDVTMQSFR